MNARRIALLLLVAYFAVVGCAMRKKTPPVSTSQPTTTAPQPPSEAPAESPSAVGPQTPAPEPGPPPGEEPGTQQAQEPVAPQELTTPEAQAEPRVGLPEIGPTSPPVLEAPAAPDVALAKYRKFWLGMSVENFARQAMGPPSVEPSTPATGELSATTGETAIPEATPEQKIPSRPYYKTLPLVVEEPGVSRFVYTNPGDPGIDHITFMFFKDRLFAIDVYYRTSFFDNVILDDYLKRIKGIYGDSPKDAWQTTQVQGNLVWDDQKYNVQLNILDGRPFSLKLLQSEIKKEQQDYAEELRKKRSEKKVENLKF